METLVAATTRSIYFNSPSHTNYFGKRYPAGTLVEVRETRRGLKAVIHEGWNTYSKFVTLEDLNPNI